MTTVNFVLGRMLDAVLLPFRGLPPLAGLAFVSLLTAVFMLLVFKATSNQEHMAAVKRRIHASLFEIRLFNDDLRAIFRAQLEILRHNVTYVRLSLVPLLWMIVPLVFAIAHLNAFYGYEPLAVGDVALVSARLAPGAEPEPVRARPEATLSADGGLAIDEPPIWIPALGELTWRVTATAPGTHTARLTLGGRTFEKRVLVSERVVPLSAVRPARGLWCRLADPEEPVRRGAGLAAAVGLWCQLLHPAEPPLEAGAPLSAIHVGYRTAAVGAFGLATHWIVVYVILSMVFAFALRNRFKVVI